MGKGWSVLVVEDDVATAELIKAQLGTAKMKARLAYNGQEAILKTGSHVPELIVMDVMMPLLDGLEASRYFKHKFAMTYVPILVLTAKLDDETRNECAKIGCDYFMAKPHDMDALLQTATDLCTIARAQKELDTLRAKLREMVNLPKKKLKKMGPVEDNSAELIAKMCKLHAKVAKSLIESDRKELVGVHADRIESLDANHAALSELRAALG